MRSSYLSPFPSCFAPPRSVHFHAPGVVALALLSVLRPRGLPDADPDWKREGEAMMPAALRQWPRCVRSTSVRLPNAFFCRRGQRRRRADGGCATPCRGRTRGGAENVSFEGIRCATFERRIYASGRKDDLGGAENSAWQPIVESGYNRPRAALAHDYFLRRSLVSRATTSMRCARRGSGATPSTSLECINDRSGHHRVRQGSADGFASARAACGRCRARACPDAELGAAERSHAAALMRVNHVGEVRRRSARAVHHVARARDSRHPAPGRRQETEHLAWTERRIAELGGRKSLPNPPWYGGRARPRLAAGASASAGNLGFWLRPSARSSSTSRAISTPAGRGSEALARDRRADEGGRGRARRDGAAPGCAMSCRHRRRGDEARRAGDDDARLPALSDSCPRPRREGSSSPPRSSVRLDQLDLVDHLGGLAEHDRGRAVFFPPTGCCALDPSRA